MRAPLVLAALLLSIALPARAQRTEVAPQSRVRVFLTPQRDVEGYTAPQVLRGTLVALDTDSLTLQIHPGTGPIRVARSAVRRIDVSRGVPSRAASAAIGAIGGAALGALEFWVLNDEEFGSDGEAAWTGAAVGAGFGLITGALWPHERWKRARFPEARVSIAPGASGTLIGFSIVR